MRLSRLLKTSLFEKPLSNVIEGGGYLSIFNKICIVGDSLSSGEVEYVNKKNERFCFDMYDRSWGSIIDKKTGAEIVHMSYGGASCESILKKGESNDYFSNKYFAEAYIIALGYNDLVWSDKKIGRLSDIGSRSMIDDLNQLLFKLKNINPNAVFFFVDMPKVTFFDKKIKNKIKEYRKCLIEFTNNFDKCYLLDIYKYGPVHNNKFKERFYKESHLNFEGYYLTSCIIISYIDFIIRKNKKSFLSDEYYVEITKGKHNVCDDF